MFVLNNKFEIGEEVYSVTMNDIQYKCPCCNGSGKLNVMLITNAPNINDTVPTKCYYCNGVGSMRDNSKRIWVVMGPCRISSVKARFTDVGVVDVKYLIHGPNGSNRRGEGRIFRTKEEAQAFCDDLNSEIIAKIAINN